MREELHGILLRTVAADLLPAISECVREPSLFYELASDYRDQILSCWNEHASSAQKALDSEGQLWATRRDLNRKADNIVDALQHDGKSPLLTQRLTTIQENAALRFHRKDEDLGDFLRSSFSIRKRIFIRLEKVFSNPVWSRVDTSDLISKSAL
ncbi:MAG: hypothetical protein P4K86_01225 [Terracidiphilus sp.]|nr:hypothetical protein [Terracidiphilus sp.]